MLSKIFGGDYLMRRAIFRLIALNILVLAILTCSKNKSTNIGGIPAAPSNLIGEPISSSAIRLSWIDNSNNESGFAIYRSQFDSFDHADTISAGRVLFTAEDLEDSTTYAFHVMAFNDAGFSAPSNDVSLTTWHSSSAPSIPGDPVPADSAVNQSVNSPLSWHVSGDDSLSYDVYIGPQNPPPFVIHQDSTSYITPISFNNGTVYYWRIVAINAAQTRTSSPIWSFTTEGVANQPPNAPSNPVPVDSAVDVTVNTQLSWQCSDPDSDSLNYDIYFGTSDPPPFIQNQSASNYAPQETLTYNTQYFWMIIAHDSQSQTAGPVWRFTTIGAANLPPNPPSNPTPADGQTDVLITTGLSWQDSDPEGDSLNFDLYFGTTEPPPLIGNQRDTTYAPPTPLDGGTTYYWMIIAHDSHNNQTSGPLWLFTTEAVNRPPSAPSNPSPPDGQYGVAHDVILTWQASDPDGDSINFDVSFGTIDPPPFIQNQIAASYDPPDTLADSVTYYWTITVHDNRGAQTAGPVWSFTTSGPVNQPPLPPSEPAPADSQVDIPLNTIISWQGSDPEDDPLTYDVYFGTAESPPFVRNQTGISYNPPGDLSYGTVYHWQIVAHDDHNNQTAGPVWSFTTIVNQPPDAPSDPRPADGEDNVDVNANLSWQDSDPESDPLIYDVYLGTSSTPPLVISGRDQANYDPGEMLDSTMYYWRIVAHDDHGNSTSGPLWTFITAPNLAPLAPSDPSPSDGATGVHTDASLTWQDSDPENDPLNYDIYFGQTDPPPFIHNQSSRRYNPPGRMDNETTYYWRIIAHDDHGNQTIGPVWSFTTAQ